MEDTQMTIVLRAKETSRTRVITATHQGLGARRIVELFGSDTVPTAFSFDGVEDISGHMAYVLAEVQRLNPSDSVVWDYASVRFIYPASQELARF
jgi:hypothetical protein